MAPGIFYVNSKIVSPALSPEAFTSWYEDVHIPDILKTSGMKTAYRYKSTDPSAERPYLALYPLASIEFLQTDEFNSIPNNHHSLPGPSQLIFDFVNFDTRCYEHVQTYEGYNDQGTKPGPADMIMVAAITPTQVSDEEWEDWYRKEHCYETSRCPGYRRTRRFRLVSETQLGPSGVQEQLEAPRFVTLLEVDGEEWPSETMLKTGETPWSKKCLESARIEVAVFKLLKGFGDVKAKL